MVFPFFAIFLLQIFMIRCELIKDPTLKPADPFLASADGEVLKNNHRASHRDLDKVANLIFHRTISQRKEIENYYNEHYCVMINQYGKKTYGCELRTDLLSRSCNSLQNLYKITFQSFPELLGTTLSDALNGKWKEKGVVEEILCANDEEMKEEMKEFYKGKYECQIEEHMKLYKKDDVGYQEAINKYCLPPRCQTAKITNEVATNEAKALQDIDYKKDKDKFKTKLKEFLDKYCEPDLKKIFENYKKDDKSITKIVEKVFEGDEERVYNVLTRYMTDTCKYYADELHNAVDGCGTDIDKINRIILTRSERDLGCIFNKYKEIHGETFTNRLDDDTTEDRYLESIRYLCGKT